MPGYRVQQLTLLVPEPGAGLGPLLGDLGGAAPGAAGVLHRGDLHLGQDGELHELHLLGGQQVVEHDHGRVSRQPLKV